MSDLSKKSKKKKLLQVMHMNFHTGTAEKKL